MFIRHSYCLCFSYLVFVVLTALGSTILPPDPQKEFGLTMYTAVLDRFNGQKSVKGTSSEGREMSLKLESAKVLSTWAKSKPGPILQGFHKKPFS